MKFLRGLKTAVVTTTTNELECKTRYTCGGGLFKAVQKKDKGAAKDLLDTFGRALFKAVQNGDLKAVNALLDSGTPVDVNWENYSYYNRTVIFLAISKGDISMVDLLIRHGANLKICDKNRETVLHVALREGHYDIALLLLDNGAQEIINKQNNDGNTPLMVGIGMISKNTLLLSMLIYKGADISITNNEGYTALSIALKHRNESKIISMLEEYSY